MPETVRSPLPRIDEPLIVLIFVPLISAACLPLNVDQSAADSAPRLVADAVGTFSVMTGVLVPVATVEDKSVPLVPRVNAATLVTVPTDTEPPSEIALPLIVIDELVSALLAMPDNVPPSVKEPELVTVPLSVRPFTVPVPLTLVTVPTYWSADEIVKLGYVPVIVVVPPCVSTTVWSGAVFVTVMLPEVVIGPPVALMPVPGVMSTLVTVPEPPVPPPN